MSKIDLGKCATEADQIKAWMESVENAVAPEDIHIVAAKLLDPTLRKAATPAQIATSFTLNGMLSGTGTFLANLVGVPTKLVAEPVNDLISKGLWEGRGLDAFAEVAAGYRTMLRNFNLAISMGKEGWGKAYPLDFNASMAQISKGTGIPTQQLREELLRDLVDYRSRLYSQATGKDFETAKREILESGYLSEKAEQDHELQVSLNEGHDYMTNVWRGKLSRFKWINIPTKATVMLDEFGKSLFRQYRMGQMAYRKAIEEAKKDPSIDVHELADSLVKRVNSGIVKGDSTTTLRNFQKETNELLGSSENMTPYDSIKDYAQRQMFQQRLTGAPASIHAWIQENSGVRMFVPFMKTPWNITKEGFSYLPGPALLMKEGYPYAAKFLKLEPNMRNLGAYYELTRSEMLARQTIGAAYFAGIMSMYDSNTITGKPRDAQEYQQWKDQEIPEQSIRIGDKWVSYARIEPVATVLGLAAELRRSYEDYMNPPAGKDPDEGIMKGIMYALKANVMQKAFVDGFNQLLNGLTEPEQEGKNLFLAATKPFTPALMNQVARIIDPHERQASTVLEKLQQRVPLARESLPIEYGLYGGGRGGEGQGPWDSTLQEWTSFNVQDVSTDPVSVAFREAGATPIRSNAELRGVGLSNEQVAEYRKRINEFITPRLQKYVSSPYFQKLPKETRKKLLKDKVREMKKPVVNRYAWELRQDPEMARKFREVELERRGLPYRDQ